MPSAEHSLVPRSGRDADPAGWDSVGRRGRLVGPGVWWSCGSGGPAGERSRRRPRKALVPAPGRGRRRWPRRPRCGPQLFKRVGVRARPTPRRCAAGSTAIMSISPDASAELTTTATKPSMSVSSTATVAAASGSAQAARTACSCSEARSACPGERRRAVVVSAAQRDARFCRRSLGSGAAVDTHESYGRVVGEVGDEGEWSRRHRQVHAPHRRKACVRITRSSPWWPVSVDRPRRRPPRASGASPSRTPGPAHAG